MKDHLWARLGAFAATVGLVLLASSTGGPRGAQAQETPISAYAAPRPGTSAYARLAAGMAAYDARDWAALASLRDGADDPLVKRILQWRFAAAADSPATFEEVARALRDLPGWPGRAGMKARAEQAIFASSLGPAARIAFFDEIGAPSTGDGKIALAQALALSGRREEGVRLAREAWREDTLSDAAEAEALAGFSQNLTQDDFATRVDMLLWRGDRSGAQRYLSRISAADQAVARARIALQTSLRLGLQNLVDAVPASRADQAGLLYDRARYVRRAGRPEDALPIVARIAPASAPTAQRGKIFEERRLYVPRALRGGQRTLAYRLVSNHGMTSGENFADAEWLAGWLSLRFNNNPQLAAQHFAHLADNVSSPISKARALYWRAEAERALGQSAAADADLAEAARYNYTYYGQLAATRAGPAVLALDTSTAVSAEARARFESRELVQALKLIADLGDRADFESIAYYLDDTLDDPGELELLAQMARSHSYQRTALRSAKAGLRRGVLAANSAYPLMDLPDGARLPGRAEPALTLAIIRQESEFDAEAVSPARARGLMQLMPTTARIQAQREGIRYDGPAVLTSDPAYNVTLGAAHLGGLVSDFGGSYVLAIAAYNAGSSRVNEWIGDWGDPRLRSVDTVDWIELIPFGETRNYVQRVMENLQVYRARLAGGLTPIMIQEDLNRGVR
ncbi:MAG: transglycosylase SLT domain-containing protein [Hyphomonadaceae bacterium]